MSTPQGPNTPNISIVSDWRRMPGTARNYQNVRTGEILSRRQYDRLYGNVARQGFESETQMRYLKARARHGFYVERFPVGTRKGRTPGSRAQRAGLSLPQAWQALIRRIESIGGHRRMYVSAHGLAGYLYPDKQYSMLWTSTPGFYNDTQPPPGDRFTVPPSGDLLYGSRSRPEWIWDNLTAGYVIDTSIDEFVLRWQP